MSTTKGNHSHSNPFYCPKEMTPELENKTKQLLLKKWTPQTIASHLDIKVSDVKRVRETIKEWLDFVL